jgi:hypothetical protein
MLLCGPYRDRLGAACASSARLPTLQPQVVSLALLDSVPDFIDGTSAVLTVCMTFICG